MVTRVGWTASFTGVALVVTMILTLWASQACAEGFLEAYAGPSFTDSARVKVEDFSTSTSGNVSFRADITYGIRGGYWFAKVPWFCIGGDLASQHASGDHASFDYTPLSLLFMFRLPLDVSEEIPQGRIQPYLGIGPSVSFYTHYSTDVGVGSSDWGFSYGFLLPAGLKVQLSRHVALFGEYRFTYHDIEIGGPGKAFLLAASPRTETTLTGHNLLFGAAYHF